MSRRLRVGLQLAVVAALVAGLWLYLANMDWNALGAQLRAANPLAVIATVVLALLIMLCKAAAWQQLLVPRQQLTLLGLWRTTIATFASSALLPLRAGEVLRLVWLRTNAGVPVAESAAAALSEKALDVVGLAIVAVGLLCIGGGVDQQSAWLLGAALAIAGTLIVLYCIVVVRKPRWLLRFAFFSALDAITPKRMLMALLVVVGGWLLDIATIAILYDQLKIPVRSDFIAYALIGVNLAIALPSTPGQVGAWQLGATVALTERGIAMPQAFAFAILYQAVQVLPVVLAGLLLAPREVLGIGGKQKQSQDAHSASDDLVK